MNTHMCDGAEAVKVGLVLTKLSEGEDCVVISEDRRGADYKSGQDEEAKSFSFDRVVTAENIQHPSATVFTNEHTSPQSLGPELLQPLSDAVSSGFNGALLICGASSEEFLSVIDDSIIKKVLELLFSRVLSKAAEDWFISASFLQFYPDGGAIDVLNPNRQTLKPVKHPVLGSLVAGWSEVSVSSAEEACSLYKTCRDTLKTNTASVSSRCSSLFSVAVERKLDPGGAESEVCSSRLQLFSLAGGASRTDLRGVNPLVKVLDKTQHEAPQDKLLPFLLNEALTGNSRTVLIYCLHPRVPPDDETPAALALAQRARSLSTKVMIGRWCPRATEEKIRAEIMELRAVMMSKGENESQDGFRLAELTQNLQTVKNPSWEKRREESRRIKDRTRVCQTTDRKQHGSFCLKENTETMKHLQDLLRCEMEEHIREGKGNVEKVQERVTRIQQLREAVREETLKSRAATDKLHICHHSHLEKDKAQERRRHLKEHHGRLIQEEVERMERDLAQEQLPAEGPQRELLLLTRERQVLVLQMEALRAEAQQAERDLQSQYEGHQAELLCLREESLQVFRVFRQVSEEQRRRSEGRYRAVLLEAVQDAVYLSAQNQQLQADNKQLRKALGELKDARAVRGDPEPTSQQQ